MSRPVRRDLELARLAARERRLRLVIQLLGDRRVETERGGGKAPAELRQSIADFGAQLQDVRRRHAELDAGRFARGGATAEAHGTQPARRP